MVASLVTQLHPHHLISCLVMFQSPGQTGSNTESEPQK